MENLSKPLKQSKNWIVVIPARLDSSRLPRKPLVDIVGTSMIERTYRQVLQAICDETKIWIATDSDEIKKHCNRFTNNVLMTSQRCLTGTDRVAELSKVIKADLYFNVQGDEPILPPESINNFIHKVLSMDKHAVTTAVKKSHDEREYKSLSIPKMVFSMSGKLLYSSRSPVPMRKSGKMPDEFYKHVCMYSFPSDSLAMFETAGSKSPVEEVEDLEINRFLELDIPVHVVEVFSSGRAVDTVEDLEYVRSLIEQGHKYL